MSELENFSDVCAVAETAMSETVDNGNKDEIKSDVKVKRVGKMTYKALMEKSERLQNTRKNKLNKIRGLREEIKEYLSNGNITKVKCNLEKMVDLCGETKEVHDSLVSLMPIDEKDKQNTWFAAKMLVEEGFIVDVKKMLTNVVKNPDSTHPGGKKVDLDDDIGPDDSVSNVLSRHSQGSSLTGKSNKCSSKSVRTTSSTRIKAEAEKAALLARAAALKEKHALEEQEEQLRRKREQVELEAEIAATTAKLTVLQAASECGSRASANGMNSYLEKAVRHDVYFSKLNPAANAYEPVRRNPIPQDVHLKSLKDPGPQEKLLKDIGEQQASATMQSLKSLKRETQRHQTQQPKSQISLTTMFNEQEAPEFEHPHADFVPTPDMCIIMERQNEITNTLVKQQRLMSLPSREIPIFDGDPLHYRTFIRAFEHNVESKANREDCLYFLEQFTRGQPKELVQSCQHMAPDRGYSMAKELLQEHFGNDYKISVTYIEKALAWPSIKSEDVNALRSYSLFLRGCCNVMQELQYMQELNMPTNMRMIMTKLPFKLRERWRIVAHDILERSSHRAQFHDLVAFVERQVKILSDPLFGDIKDTLCSPVERSASRSKPLLKPIKTKCNSFATNVAMPDSKSQRGSLHSEPACMFCSQDHPLEVCSQLARKKHSAKILFLREKGICFGCLRSGHRSKECSRRLVCKVCGQAHPSILHINKPKSNKSAEKINATPVSSETCGHTGAGKDEAILSILPVKLKSRKGGKVIQTYAFLDPGSSATFCSEHLMQQMKITGRRSNFLLRTMGQEKVVSTNVLNGLEVSGLYNDIFYSLPEVFTQCKMPVTRDNIVTQEMLAKWPYLSDIHMPYITADIGLLIGTNAPQLLEPWEVINSQQNGPYAVRTVLGWVVNGPLRERDNSSTQTGSSVAAVNRISVCKLEEMLTNQYNHDFNEKIVEERGRSREDLRFMEIMDQSVCLQDGHYSLRMPFRNDQLTLPNNRAMVKQRLLGLKRKFEKNETFYMEYTSVLNDVIRKGYAERVPQSQLDGKVGKVWYLPHHGVVHPRKGTLRVVFDCGAEYQGTSLNSQLLQGPNLTSSLLGVITRFREKPIALMGDIQSMFHQVKVTEEDRDFLRFLWWDGGNMDKMAEYRMVVHLFGAVSSPSCASYALRKTAKDNSICFSADVVETVYWNFYVDDCLKSLSTVEEAVVMSQALTDLCQRGGFTLTKWTSNSRAVLQTIAEEDRAKDLSELDLDRDELPVERALGLQWCVEKDMFKFKMMLKDQPYTRRGMLSVISSVYDPLGFLAPVTLSAKFMLQELCRRHHGWDNKIPEDIRRRWGRWLQDLEGMALFQVKRCIKPKDFGCPTQSQLHLFSDASQDGYGTVTYIRMGKKEGKIQVSFLLGKARVTPLKPVTIPRLELTAAVLAVRVDQMLRAELQFPLDESVFWTDSTSVLRYIQNEDKRFHTFVANRVSTIRDATKVSQWRHVNTKDNPADDASRGLKASDLLNGGRWIEGPKFLFKPEEDWPANTTESAIPSDDPEVRRNAAVNATIIESHPNAMDRLISYFSDWRKLKVAVGWFLRLRGILLGLKQRRKELQDAGCSVNHVRLEMKRFKEAVRGQTLLPEELLKAEISIIRYSQRQRFEEEMAALSAGNAVARGSIIYKLDPFLEDGLLRVGGRLSRAALPEEIKHPLLLSKDQYISTLILRAIHQQTGHSGRSQMLSTLRRRFWITNANSAVRKLISQCCICRRYNSRIGEQKMADLPKERVLPDLPPFTNVGIDYFGPIEVKRGRSRCKRYGVIFTCLASRAVHLEVASSLDTDACINALRRFVSRRGQVSSMRSDNGTNFVGAERELREALNALNQDKIRRALLGEGIEWHFNPPAASHHGGVWERVIRMVRKVLSSVLRLQTLDDDGLHTVLCEAEAILNDRPITKLSDDPNDLEPLTPNHLLLMKGKPVMAPGLFNKEDLYSRRRWRQVQYIADLFWKRWTQEYLPLLQERQKWNQKQRSFIPGDIVIVVDTTAPRGTWLLGRVLKTFPDKRGFVRSVQLQTKSNILERPVTKLCLLQEATND